MKNKEGANGCLVFLAIAFGLIFWQITIVLILSVILQAIIRNFQNQAYSEYATKWEKNHALTPCVYGGRYGFIKGVAVKGDKLTLSIKPIRSLLPNSTEAPDNYTIKIRGGSVNQSIRKLFKNNSIEFLYGVSVELSAIESALKCQEQLTWCIETMNALVKMSDQIDRGLSLAEGNPLLEPSIPAMTNAKAKITNESITINNAREFSLDTLKDLIDYLSVPAELRQLSEITELESLISLRHDDLQASYNELIEFNSEYIKLIS